jgi:hypothetical protein
MCKKSHSWLNTIFREGKNKNLIRLLELLDARIPGFMEQFIIVKKSFEEEEK